MRLLITGASGTLGRQLARIAADAGYSVRAQSRQCRAGGREPVEWVQADLETGSGLEAALRDVDVVVHCASDPRRSAAVDVGGTRRLVASAGNGVAHLVHVSIVGIDHIPFRYYRHKLEAERIVAESAVPHSILRATQFHSLVDGLLRAAARVPFVLPLPARFRFQSVDSGEVAARLLECVEAGPRGRVRDLAGPETLTIEAAAAVWRRVVQVRKRAIPVPIPGRVASAFRAGLNTTRDADPASITWEKWLSERAAADPR